MPLKGILEQLARRSFVGDPDAIAKAEAIVQAHVASHPELMAIAPTERQAAHASH